MVLLRMTMIFEIFPFLCVKASKASVPLPCKAVELISLRIGLCVTQKVTSLSQGPLIDRRLTVTIVIIHWC